MTELEDVFFDTDALPPETAGAGGALGRAGSLEHEHFSGRRFLQVLVVGIWGVALVVAATLTWNATRFAAPGLSRWVVAAGGLVMLAVSLRLAGSSRERYEPAADEDPVFTELQSGFQERYRAGAADFAWAVVALAPLLVLFAT